MMLNQQIKIEAKIEQFITVIEMIAAITKSKIETLELEKHRK